jgi:hypothetical protein
MRKRRTYLLAILVLTVFFSPASVVAGRNHHSHHGHNYGDVFWPVLGAEIVVGILYNVIVPRPVFPPPPEVYYSPPPVVYYTTPPMAYRAPPPQRICYEKTYGEWKIDRYGNQYWKEYSQPKRVRVSCW